MKTLLRTFNAAIVLLSVAGALHAEQPNANAYARTLQGDYELVTESLSDAIVNKGLVIDYVGEVGSMLERTGSDVGAMSPYINARYLQFCSASATHAAVTASPENIAVCPYIVFSYELKATPGQIVVGYRRPVGDPGSASKIAVTAIEDLLKSIVDEVSP